jgi:hypothetical protein
MTMITRTLGRLWIFALPLVIVFAEQASGSVGGTLAAGSGVHANETG